MKLVRCKFALLALAFAGFTTAHAHDPLPSWNDTAPKRFCLDVDHADAEPEWIYDRKSHIGQVDEAAAKGWIVVSMKDD